MAKPFVKTPTRWQRALIVMATFVTIILVFACLYWAKQVLVPLALAVLLTFLLSPLVTWLQRRGLQRGLAVLLVIFLAVSLLAGLAGAVVWQVSVLAQNLPEYEANIRSKLADLRQLDNTSTVDRISAAFERISADIENKKEGVLPALPVHVENQERGTMHRLAAAVLPVLEPLVGFGLVLVLVIFLLMKRESMRDRLIRLMGPRHLTLATKAIDDAGNRISRYLVAQLFLNSTFGFLVGLGLFIIGVPFAILWGVLGAVLRYIPYLGAWLSALIPIAISVLMFKGWWEPMLVVLLFAVLEPLIGMVLEPIVFGHSVGVSEAALLVALAFWTWIWGPVGLLLATPMTVCLVVLGEYVPSLEFFNVLLGATPVLDNDVRFYQRLLAGDKQEAREIALDMSKHGALEVCETIIVPAMQQAKRDKQAARLGPDEAAAIAEQTMHVLAEVLPAEEDRQTTDHDGETPRVPVLLVSVSDEIDDVAVEMLGRLIASPRCEPIALNSGVLPAEVCAQVCGQQAPIVCLVSLSPNARARTRYLVKLLRKRCPDLKIVVASFATNPKPQKWAARLCEVGADTVAVTLRLTVQCLRELATRDSYRRKGTAEADTGLAVEAAS